jgi:hypothetical protein
MSQDDHKDEHSEDAAGFYVDPASEEASSPIETSLSPEMEEMLEHQLEMIEVAQANANAAFDFARNLVSAKTPSQLMDLCSIHAQKQLGDVPTEQIRNAEREREGVLPRAYIEARPKGREFDPITDFSVEDNAGQVLAAFDTQMEAIVWAKDAGHEALVTRDRELTDRDNPDHWRAF